MRRRLALCSFAVLLSLSGWSLAQPIEVRLAWDAVDAPTLAGYHVYRRVGTEPQWTRLTSQPVPQGTPALPWRDPRPEPGPNLYYITAVDSAGVESSGSNQAGMVICATVLP